MDSFATFGMSPMPHENLSLGAVPPATGGFSALGALGYEDLQQDSGEDEASDGDYEEKMSTSLTSTKI